MYLFRRAKNVDLQLVATDRRWSWLCSAGGFGFKNLLGQFLYALCMIHDAGCIVPEPGCKPSFGNSALFLENPGLIVTSELYIAKGHSKIMRLAPSAFEEK